MAAKWEDMTPSIKKLPNKVKSKVRKRKKRK